MLSFSKMLLIWPLMILDTLENSMSEPVEVIPLSSSGRKLPAMRR